MQPLNSFWINDINPQCTWFSANMQTAIPIITAAGRLKPERTDIRANLKISSSRITKTTTARISPKLIFSVSLYTE